ncbi:MAG: aminoacyl-histidine dipeptidase [bacterium]
MASVLEALQPASIWREFDALTRIPRPSKDEARVRAHVKGLFAGRGWEIREDATGNMVVRVPATAGHERAPVTILQAHLDMVCEKNSDTVFDWDKDALNVWIDGDWVKARGTTLGADNGIGVAAAIASALDASVTHGPLELLFTVDEETGLTGAMGLDGAMLAGRRLINMDSEEDGVLYVGCSGGCNSTLTFDAEMVAPPAGAEGAVVRVTGLAGGHSGGEIHENRGNAIKVLTRFLARALGGAAEAGAKGGDDLAVELASVSGGNKHNAIPREAEAALAIPPGRIAALTALAASERDRALVEFATSDPGLSITVTAAAVPARVMARRDRDRLVALFAALPSGVLAMSRDIRGLVETSNNLASVRTDGARVVIVTSSRSSVPPALRATLDTVAAAARLAGARPNESDGYPGWQPNMASPLLAVCKRVFSQLYGREPGVAAIHAGLETGLIGKKIPGIDMISYGPEIKGPHSPDERVQISSVARFWEYHKAVLAALAAA